MLTGVLSWTRHPPPSTEGEGTDDGRDHAPSPLRTRALFRPSRVLGPLPALSFRLPGPGDGRARRDDRRDLRAPVGRSCSLGYTESQGLPELRAEIAGDLRLGRRGPGDPRTCSSPLRKRPSSSPWTRCSLPGITWSAPSPATSRSTSWREHRLRGRPLAGEPVGRREPVALRPGRTGGADAPRYEARGLELSPQPHRSPSPLPTTSPGSMLDAAARVGAWLFSDEMYRLLEPSPDRRLPAAVDRYERAVSLARHVEGLRAGRAAHRLGGGPRPGSAASGCKASRTTRRSVAAPPASCWP